MSESNGQAGGAGTHPTGGASTGPTRLRDQDQANDGSNQPLRPAVWR